MISASLPRQRPADARLLVLTRDGRLCHVRRARLLDLLRAGDLLVANDAATLPASLRGIHEPTGREIEVRLAARASLNPADVRHFTAVVFGPGTHHIRTENRPLPPKLQRGDLLRLGSLTAEVEELLGHPRLARLGFRGTPSSIWSGLSREGAPIQYAHIATDLELWDVWTAIAAVPAAFEPPSAGFVLDWALIRELKHRRIGFVTLTHAAGISSTGDPELDRRLPLDEPYNIPAATAEAIMRTRQLGGRVVAVGTTVVRAIEHAAAGDGSLISGPGLADQRLGPHSTLRILDAVISGTHEIGTSHYELLRAFAHDEALEKLSASLDAHGYRTHEFGDSVMIEAAA